MVIKIGGYQERREVVRKAGGYKDMWLKRLVDTKTGGYNDMWLQRLVVTKT